MTVSWKALCCLLTFFFNLHHHVWCDLIHIRGHVLEQYCLANATGGIILVAALKAKHCDCAMCTALGTCMFPYPLYFNLCFGQTVYSIPVHALHLPTFFQKTKTLAFMLTVLTVSGWTGVYTYYAQPCTIHVNLMVIFRHKKKKSYLTYLFYSCHIF